MHDSESRSLRRAMVALVVVSIARIGWEAATAPPTPPPRSVAVTLADSVESAVEEEERRREPLGPGERLDPNVAPEIELDRLPGVGPALASAIASARVDGAVFRTPADLEAVRGIGPSLAGRIGPHLRFDAAPRVGAFARRSPDVGVDLNRAPAAELETLPGVGPAIAARIVEHRRGRAFRRVEDLLEVPGIGPATLEGLRPRVAPIRTP